MEDHDRSWLDVSAAGDAASSHALADRLRRRPALLIALAIGSALAVALAGVALTATAAAPRIDLGGISSEGATGSLESGVAAEGGLLVDVAGAVRHPGVYRLAAGSRLRDAIEAAGGYGPSVDALAVTSQLNLAAQLVDGQKIVIPARGPAQPTSPSTTAGQGPAGLVDLNHASQSELEALPGIGPVSARKIIDARTERPFADTKELLERKLVGPSTWEKLRGLVTAG